MVKLTVTATDCFEVEVDLTGTFAPGERETGPTYACGGTPAIPDSMEDVEVTELRGLRRVGGGWSSTDLLAGLDAAARAKVFANIADFIAESAIQQLLAEVPEADDDR